jgi:hypothetical protein
MSEKLPDARRQAPEATEETAPSSPPSPLAPRLSPPRIEEGERRILASAWIEVVAAQRTYAVVMGTLRRTYELDESVEIDTETGEIKRRPAPEPSSNGAGG